MRLPYTAARLWVDMLVPTCKSFCSTKSARPFFKNIFSAAHSSRNSFTSLSISLSSIKCTHVPGRDCTKTGSQYRTAEKVFMGRTRQSDSESRNARILGTNWNSVLFLMATRRRRSQWHNKRIAGDSRNKCARYKTHSGKSNESPDLAFVFGRHMVAHIGDFLAALSIVRSQRMWVDSVCRLVEMPMKCADNPLECVDAFACFE